MVAKDGKKETTSNEDKKKNIINQKNDVNEEKAGNKTSDEIRSEETDEKNRTEDETATEEDKEILRDMKEKFVRKTNSKKFDSKSAIALEKELVFDFLPSEIDGGESSEEDTDDIRIHNEREEIGFTQNMAAVFIVSSVTGSGIVSLPYALMLSDWMGIFFLLLSGINALYSGICLGRCWLILEERWSEYKMDYRSPYPAIGFRALGEFTKYVVMMCMDISMCGSCIVYVLMMAALMDEIWPAYILFCYFVVILVILLTPFTWFGKPRNFRFLAVIDVICSAAFVILFTIALFYDKEIIAGVHYKETVGVTKSDVYLSFGIMLFSYGAGAYLPTIQNDMKNRKEFPYSVSTAYLVVFVLYVPLAVIGYAAYGISTFSVIIHNVARNSDLTLLAHGLRIIFNVQLFTTFVITFNPIAQNWENLLSLPKTFGCKRCAFRGGLIFIIFMVTFSIPYFRRIIELMAAITTNLLTYVFPPVFYISLAFQNDPKHPRRRISKKEWILLIEVLVIGVISILACSYLAIVRILTNAPHTTSCFGYIGTITEHAGYFLTEIV
ncbi:amino acid transporter AVT1C-like isoform X1 [Stegodyphus dumicola]|uniref:amino acid transporter AVT1C-like isoform X1 n=1 Tax=Stegodyphus dumicola TaxID=202533 RepID=UPI0015ABD270|nr:amino acid transporter AVT1C-like isoform X1 [Stegodyphus dumicola]